MYCIVNQIKFVSLITNVKYELGP